MPLNLTRILAQAKSRNTSMFHLVISHLHMRFSGTKVTFIILCLWQPGPDLWWTSRKQTGEMQISQKGYFLKKNAHIRAWNSINGTRIAILLMLILVFIDVSTYYVFGVGFTPNMVLDIKVWWTGTLFFEYLILFLGKYVWPSVLPDNMWQKIHTQYCQSWTSTCKYWVTPAVH